MSHAKSKRNKHTNKDISKEDSEELELLNLQLLAVQLYFCSDIFFYRATITSYEFLDYNFEDIKDAKKIEYIDIQCINKYLITSAFSSLISRIVLGIVDFTRYRELEERYKKGKIQYSLTPNIFLMSFDMLNMIAYTYVLFGYIQLYEVDIYNFIQVFDKSYTKVLLSVQEQAISIRILGTCSIYESTLRSIELIYDKYTKKTKKRVKPPYESALEALECYLTARMMLEEVDFQLFYKVFTDIDDIEAVEAYRTLWEGIVYGVIANFQGLVGIAGIKARNINQPIFGI